MLECTCIHMHPTHTCTPTITTIHFCLEIRAHYPLSLSLLSPLSSPPDGSFSPRRRAKLGSNPAAASWIRRPWLATRLRRLTVPDKASGGAVSWLPRGGVAPGGAGASREREDRWREPQSKMEGEDSSAFAGACRMSTLDTIECIENR